jgi:Histidine kinase-, DNA gyrase B-, and HSP90-like ATPase
MTQLTLKAKNDYLQKVASTRDFVKAIAEFVWNALDADATQVSVELIKNALGGLEKLVIRDNGSGISHKRAAHDFESLGDPNHREFLLIELKRPSLVVGRKELDQLEDYVTTLLSQPDFINTPTTWNFYLVSTEYDGIVKERITQDGRPVGLATEKSNYKVWVKSWSEIIRDCDSRLKFVQDNLRIEVSAEEIQDRIASLKSSVLKSASSKEDL